MKLTRDNGASPLDQWSTLRSEINRLFDLPWTDVTPTSQLFDEGWVPAVDVFEDRDNLIVKAELPGLSKEAIDIHLHDGSLTISGERKSEEQNEEVGAYRSERFFGRFHRTLSLPKSVDVTKVSASYRDGVLLVTLPKAEEAKPRQIQVNVS